MFIYSLKVLDASIYFNMCKILFLMYEANHALFAYACKYAKLKRNEFQSEREFGAGHQIGKAKIK